ncbi:MAG: transposase, partial [Deltaproteobacteria bacterium]|nr:transposase [Deltaproteobacteria bacterium]
RSIGGWTVLKGLRKVGIRLKGDERILGSSDFVENVLKSAKEELEQKYDLIDKGYDFDRVAQRVAEIMAMDVKQVTAFGKSPKTVKARSLLCFWAHRKLGMTTIEIGKRLNISQSAVSRSSMRGQKIETENWFKLID